MTKPHLAGPDCDIEIDNTSKTTVKMPKQKLQRRSPEIPRRSRHHGTINSDAKRVGKSSTHRPEDSEDLDSVTEPFENRSNVLSMSTSTFQPSPTSNELITGAGKEDDASLEDELPESEGSEDEDKDEFSEVPKSKRTSEESIVWS